MRRRIGTGILLVGACGACWIAPLLVGLLGAGSLGALGAGWAWMIAAAGGGAIALVAERHLRRRKHGACACPPP